MTSVSYSVKMLEKSVQAIYGMKNLQELLTTDEGEDVVLRRLRVIDMARNFLNSIAIDSDGETYDFKSMTAGPPPVRTLPGMETWRTGTAMCRGFGRLM